MNFKPLGERVLVKRLEEMSTTATGIIIPDNAKEKPSQGEVVAVADDVEELNEGDTIVFGKYAGSEITIEGKEYLIIEISDVLGTLA